MSEEKKEECCSTQKGCGCCCGSKIIAKILIALLIFGAGYCVGKHCPAQMCPFSQQMQQVPVQK